MEDQKARLSQMTLSWDKAATEEKMIVIQGDWNVDMLAWTQPQHNHPQQPFQTSAGNHPNSSSHIQPHPNN